MWALILHGGAEAIPPERRERFREGVRRAAETGAAVLKAGGSAPDAVTAAVSILEDDPTFNAGTGAAQTDDGDVELCAAVMEGSEYGLGAVSLLRGFANPVRVARAMLDDDIVLLGGPGAERFAESRGFPRVGTDVLKAGKPEGARADTVGAVALDARGHLAVATSTGGIDGKPAGRIGDSPQPGCGFYADDRVGAVGLSGDGELIARAMLAARIMHALPTSPPDAALRSGIEFVGALGGEAGGIIVLPDGSFGWWHNSQDFAVAMVAEGDEQIHVYLNKREASR